MSYNRDKHNLDSSLMTILLLNIAVLIAGIIIAFNFDKIIEIKTLIGLLIILSTLNIIFISSAKAFFKGLCIELNLIPRKQSKKEKDTCQNL